MTVRFSGDGSQGFRLIFASIFFTRSANSGILVPYLAGQSMKITRIAALSVILASTASSALYAQGLRTKGAPAEFPPASFTGKQYVDSRGCVYIRAGLDGYVTWVPRVDRTRKHICGQQPTPVQGVTTKAQPRAVQPVELITVEPTDLPPVSPTAKPKTTAPAAATATQTVRPKPLKPAVRAAKPATTGQVPRKAVPVVKKPTVAPVTAPTLQTPPAGQGSCPGASALSQRYINQSSEVRCGPQELDPLSALPPGTGFGDGPRVYPAHVYQERLASRGIEVPEGYRPVWQDGRMNPFRAQTTLQVAVPKAVTDVPKGYAVMDRNDDRLNRNRGPQTAEGDAQMAQFWTSHRGMLVPVVQPLDRPVYSAEELRRQGQYGAVAIVSRRAVTTSAVFEDVSTIDRVAPRYVRAQGFESRGDAVAAAKALRAATGLPVRLGVSQGAGNAPHVVLAGPFADQAEAALALVRQSGHSSARLSK